MLPLEPWLAAMNIESHLPSRPPQLTHTTHSGHGALRRVVHERASLVGARRILHVRGTEWDRIR